MTPAERKAAKLALTRSIRMREAELARLGPYVKDPYLESVRERLRVEIAERWARREALDHLDPARERELAAQHLGYSRYDR